MSISIYNAFIQAESGILGQASLSAISIVLEAHFSNTNRKFARQIDYERADGELFA